MSNDWNNLASYARKKHSQCGEEGVLERIFELIGTTNRVSVEFGCSDGYSLSNTRLFQEQGWTSHFWDCKYENEEIRKHYITAENINRIFEEEEVPTSFDLLSLDIDGNDYWVWRALQRWQARAVVIEFNGALLPGKRTIPYSPDFKYDGTDYYGASFDLLCHLGRQKGYVPVCQLGNLNLFFVRSELVPLGQEPPVTYTPQPCHLPDPKKRSWYEVDE